MTISINTERLFFCLKGFNREVSSLESYSVSEHRTNIQPRLDLTGKILQMEKKKKRQP